MNHYSLSHLATQSTISETAAKIHNEIMKNTQLLTGVKVKEDGLSDNLRKLA